MMDEAAIQKNVDGISSVFAKFLDFEDPSDGSGDGSNPNTARLVNNDGGSNCRLRQFVTQLVVGQLLSLLVTYLVG